MTSSAVEESPAPENGPSGPGPLVTVVVPSFNRLDILPRCLEALMRQDYQPYEIIVVDDGSTDGTRSFLDSFAVEHPEVDFRWLANERNLGANASRNRAIQAARGELVAFLDSDCVAEPEWLAALVRGFEHPKVAAVTGCVVDPPPSNVYERTFKGTHRVHGRGPAPRLVAGNMCIRRRLLLETPLDQDLKYGCDEEGIYLRLRAAGHEQRTTPDAIVHHLHYYTRRSFFRQARVGGAAAAWLVYKYDLPPRLDLLPFMLGYLTLPLGLWSVTFLAVPAFFFCGALAALLYNERLRKAKSWGEALRTFPLLLLYYQVRLAGYVHQAWRLRLRPNRIERVRLRTPRATSPGDRF